MGMDMDTDRSDISICNIKNKENGEDLTVYTEWSDSKLKIVITKADSILEGEVLKQSFNRNAETFEKSLTDFLKETHDILSGKNDDIDFILKNEKFFWKRNKWSLGEISVKPLLEISRISNLLLNILSKFSRNIKDLSEIEEKQKNNENTISELRVYNIDFVKKKEQSESEWYKRSILMINAKKAHIRNLKKKVNKYESEKDQIFDTDTEDSQSETETTVSKNIKKSKRKPKYCLESDSEKLTKKKKCDVQTEALDSTISDIRQKQSKRKPRQSLESDEEKSIKRKKCDISVQTEYLIEETPMKEESTLASTSKTQLSSNIGEDEETPDFLTDESECEVELKFEDDKNHDTETQGNAMVREESSEELF